ncbi:SIMPL domain-containing protein [Salipaludibacillus sp. CF4.18]|uniref:SIMPL domain-containing protein n=1 Tax=Salipaludibacillus sp. CF4.18 TaxID=3373081 RepID=UPI003EE5BE57
MSKKNWLIASGSIVGTISVILLLQILFSPFYDQPATANVSDGIQEGTLVVSAVGEVSAEPDMAYIHLGAEAVDTSADDAQTEVNQKIEAIRLVLEEHGVEDAHIKTAQLDVYPHQQFDSQANGNEDAQYLAQHILEIEYRDIDRLGEFIDDVSEAGANRIQQTRFVLRDSEAAENKALQQAIEKTVGKADAMAESANRERGEVLQIADQQSQVDFPMQSSAEMSEEDSRTNVESGEVKITQRVDVVYQLK